MWCEVEVKFLSVACGYPIVPALFVEMIILSPLDCLGTLVENQLTVEFKSKLQWAF